MTTRYRRLAASMFLLMVVGTERPAVACGPFPPLARFWNVRLPGPSLEAFLAGDIGVLDSGLRHVYHYVAYRHLSGVGLDRASRENLWGYWQTPTADPNSVSQLPEELTRGLDVYRQLERTEAGNVYTVFFQNCLPDALATAERTYADRLHRLPEDEVRLWVEAQAQVFALCSGEGLIPAPLPTTTSVLARADRDYQIASAHFYAGTLEEARRRFLAISADRASPWHALSRYLMARALVREWMVYDGGRELALQAERSLKDMLSDSEMTDLHPAAERLLGFVAARLYPEVRRAELARRLVGGDFRGAVRQDLIDYLWLVEREVGQEATGPADEMTDWLRALWGDSESTSREALDRWRERRSLPWLVLALMTGSDGEPSGELLHEASRVEKSHSAYLTVTYHRARLLWDLGREDEARGVLDGIQEDPNITMSLSDRNRFAALRVRGARDLDEFLRLSQMVPVEVGYHDGASLFARTGDPLQTYRDGRPLFDEHATTVFNRYFTPGLLYRAVQSGVLAPGLERRLAMAAWARAVVLGEESVALELVPSLSRLEPALADELEAFRKTPAGEARAFVAALIMLRFPGLGPYAEPELGRVEAVGSIDSLRHNWWCGGLPADGAGLPAEPDFLTVDEREAARSMRDEAVRLEPGPIYLGRRVLSWVGSNPGDPRAPEALHLVVRATRYGCRSTGEGGTDFGDVSRRAFQTLHRRYPDSPWTKKTPYWFR